MSDVIKLSPVVRQKTYPRRLFMCNDCHCRTFKIHETEGDVMVECSNCESIIDLDDLFDRNTDD